MITNFLILYKINSKLNTSLKIFFKLAYDHTNEKRWNECFASCVLYASWLR